VEFPAFIDAILRSFWWNSSPIQKNHGRLVETFVFASVIHGHFGGI
jgi:hypothetical protein